MDLRDYQIYAKMFRSYDLPRKTTSRLWDGDVIASCTPKGSALCIYRCKPRGAKNSGAHPARGLFASLQQAINCQSNRGYTECHKQPTKMRDIDRLRSTHSPPRTC